MIYLYRTLWLLGYIIVSILEAIGDNQIPEDFNALIKSYDYELKML